MAVELAPALGFPKFDIQPEVSAVLDGIDVLFDLRTFSVPEKVAVKWNKKWIGKEQHLLVATVLPPRLPGEKVADEGRHPCTTPGTVQSSVSGSAYTDPKLLDVHDALKPLPRLDGGSDELKRATGTDPKLAPTSGQHSQSVSFPDTRPTIAKVEGASVPIDVKSSPDTKKDLLSSRDNKSLKSGRLDLNQRPLRPERSALPG